MSDELARALQEQEYQTVESLHARLPHFTPEAIREALERLADAGVLAREAGEAGEDRFRYAAPERYRLADVPVVKQPGPDFGRR